MLRRQKKAPHKNPKPSTPVHGDASVPIATGGRGDRGVSRATKREYCKTSINNNNNNINICMNKAIAEAVAVAVEVAIAITKAINNNHRELH